MSFAADFTRFARRGNLDGLAVGFTVGAAFSTIAKSLVNHVLMSPLGLLLGRTSFSDFFWWMRDGPKAAAHDVTLADAQADGAVKLNFGVFINSLVAFAVVPMAMFFCRALGTARRKASGRPDRRPCRKAMSVVQKHHRLPCVALSPMHLSTRT